MNWSHVKLIFHREVRDQLRDRRTMFTICILPLLLYPLMGMVMMQVAQFHREQHVTIGIVGYENWPDEFPLITEVKNDKIHWRKLPADGALVDSFDKSEMQPKSGMRDEPGTESSSVSSAPMVAEKLLRQMESDAIIWVPESFKDSIAQDSLVVLSNQRWERSQLAVQHLRERMNDWHANWLRNHLKATEVGATILDPPKVRQIDASDAETKRALVWSKILPFVMLVWALTGAFYPAIDLCAGEKERGTLETLLCSPARRKEIVWGKLLTVMCFSIGTALLNLASMHTTASIVMSQFAGLGAGDMVAAMGPLPLHSMGWLILLVIPISAMFSALALAVACLARSTKEGQYYLMPLLLVGMPLVMLPMIPGVVLSPGTSIIPVTGAVLMSRALMDGEYGHALLHLPTVFTVTVLCCLLAVRWAVRQFESESVMFRDVERASMKQWIRNVWRQREDTPTTNEAVLCGLLILVCLFFGRLSLGGMSLTWTSIVQSTIVIQLAMILAPALIMATILTRSVRKSLRLHRPDGIELAGAVLLAISLHPTYAAFAAMVGAEYKLGEQTIGMLMQFDSIIASTPIWSVLLVLALIPAICEELAFRGFLFAGLLRNGGHVRAILLSSILFGLSHGVLQQTITAATLGLLIGWIAYRTGGVVCSIAFHCIHNSLSMLLAAHSSRGSGVSHWLAWVLEQNDGRIAYTNSWCTLSVGVSIALIAWFATKKSFTVSLNLRETEPRRNSSESKLRFGKKAFLP
ncbi:MAG: ABC transporter permease subunit [Planctomycetota bacterium]|nr:ABC transporter permease subunit [Planctomycetota bacterium]